MAILVRTIRLAPFLHPRWFEAKIAASVYGVLRIPSPIARISSRTVPESRPSGLHRGQCNRGGIGRMELRARVIQTLNMAWGEGGRTFLGASATASSLVSREVPGGVSAETREPFGPLGSNLRFASGLGVNEKALSRLGQGFFRGAGRIRTGEWRFCRNLRVLAVYLKPLQIPRK